VAVFACQWIFSIFPSILKAIGDRHYLFLKLLEKSLDTLLVSENNWYGVPGFRLRATQKIGDLPDDIALVFECVQIFNSCHLILSFVANYSLHLPGNHVN